MTTTDNDTVVTAVIADKRKSKTNLKSMTEEEKKAHIKELRRKQNERYYQIHPETKKIINKAWIENNKEYHTNYCKEHMRKFRLMKKMELIQQNSICI